MSGILQDKDIAIIRCCVECSPSELAEAPTSKTSECDDTIAAVVALSLTFDICSLVNSLDFTNRR